MGFEASRSAVASAAGKVVVTELRQLFPLLLADGSLAAVEGASKEPVYFPTDLPAAPGACNFGSLCVLCCVLCCFLKVSRA